MNIQEIKQSLGEIDIYLLDQLLKGRYAHGSKILDAGCGGGRNSHYFINNNYEVYGVDQKKENIQALLEQNPKANPKNFSQNKLEKIPFPDNYFDHVICNAVLHFARSKDNFDTMVQEIIRVVKPKGNIFIRMTSNFGIEEKVQSIGNGVYQLPDHSTRFLLDASILEELQKNNSIQFLEPLKTVNVNNMRCMSNLILSKV